MKRIFSTLSEKWLSNDVIPDEAIAEFRNLIKLDTNLKEIPVFLRCTSKTGMT